MAQQMIAITESSKVAIEALCARFSGPSKSKDDMAMTQKECVDALCRFAEKHAESFEIEPDDDGNDVSVPVDLFAIIAKEVMDERMGKSRQNHTAEKQKAQLQEQFAAIYKAKMLKLGMSEEEAEEATAEALATL